jgi:hypothetical protein
MDATAVFLSILVALTALLGIGALVGLLLSTWYILLPIGLLAAALALGDSGLYLPAAVAALLLAGTLWAEYRVWRG